MGTALEVTNISDRSHRKLKKAGFNSVYAPSVFSTGPEYVVYNHDQVKMVDITNTKTGVVVWTAPLCSCHGCDSPQSAKQGGGFHSHCGNSCRRGKCGHGGSAGGAEGAGPAPCRFFASTGRCKYGSGCRDSHAAGGGAGGAAAPVGGQGGQGSPLCPCPGCGRPRCANPHGGYYSHCGNYCRHARCGGSHGAAVGGGGGGAVPVPPPPPPMAPSCQCQGCHRTRVPDGGGGHFSHCGNYCRSGKCGH